MSSSCKAAAAVAGAIRSSGSPALVAEDVRNGYVSVDGAEHYGVALDPQTLGVDEAATRALRA